MSDLSKGLILNGLSDWRIYENGRGIFLGDRLLSEFLGSDFFGGEEATTWATGTTHRMLVARFMEIRLGSGMNGG